MMGNMDQEIQQQVHDEDALQVIAIGNGREDDVDDDGGHKRTGTMWTASAHIITAIVGAGVLSLAWGIAQMGWIAGIFTLLSFSFVSLYTSGLLADCYRSPSGKRNPTYKEVVKTHLGGRNYKVCALVQYVLLSGTLVNYTIASSISLVAIRKSTCYHKEGHKAACQYSNNPYMMTIGVIEILLSQIPNFHKLSWLSITAAIMSFSYAGIGIGLAFAKVVSGQGKKTSLTGVEIGLNLTAADKTWSIFRALGDISFACAYSPILVEIQDTLKPSPPENVEMKKANVVATMTATTLYLMCGCFGYAALGNLAPGNMLTGFGFYEPYWLIDFANLCIVVHLLGAYQVVAQPVFNVVESWASTNWPKSRLLNHEYQLTIGQNHTSINLFRLTWRTILVIMATLVSMAFPLFNEVLAFLGAIAYWPLTVYFPLTMYISRNNIKKLTFRWFAFQILNLVCLLAALAAAAGSVEGLYKALHTFKPFRFNG